MTRDEAIAIVTGVDCAAGKWVDAFVELGMLKLDAPAEKDHVAAINRLQHIFVHVYGGAVTQLAYDGAAEVIDVLLKSGFKITK